MNRRLPLFAVILFLFATTTGCAFVSTDHALGRRQTRFRLPFQQSQSTIATTTGSHWLGNSESYHRHVLLEPTLPAAVVFYDGDQDFPWIASITDPSVIDSGIQMTTTTTATPAELLSTFKNRILFTADYWLGLYMTLLTKRPLITKSISAAIVQAIGDILSQTLFASPVMAHGQAKPLLDLSRTVSFMLTGFFFNAPYLHRWYQKTSRFGYQFQRLRKLSNTQRVGAELALDQSVGVFVYFPLYFYAYELASSVAYGRVPDLAAITASGGVGNILAAIKAQYLFWPMVQLVSFRYVPEGLRVLVTSLASIVWNIFFCAMVARR